MNKIIIVIVLIASFVIWDKTLNSKEEEVVTTQRQTTINTPSIETKSTSSNSLEECYHAMGMMKRWTAVLSTNNGWCVDAENANTTLKWIKKAKSVCPQDMQKHLTKEEVAGKHFRDISFEMCRQGF